MTVVVAFTLLAAGGTVAYLRLRPAGGTAVNAVTSTPAPVITTPPPKPPFAGDLRTLLLPKPASAKVDNSDSPSTDGNVTVEQAVDVFGGNVTPSDLRDLGFTRGAVRGWNDNKGYDVFIKLFQFESLAQTAEWLIAAQQALAKYDQLESTAYVEGIVGARWFVNKKKSGLKQVMHGVFHRGTIWVLVTVYCPTKADVKVLTTLINSQYERLPAE